MKHTIYIQLAILLLFITGINAHAQTDAEAKTLLNKVSKTYEGYKTIQADFSVSVQQAADTYTETGTLWLQSAAGKYRIATNAQDIISDGQTQWMVLKEAQEVQITEADHSGASISLINIFSFYNTGYNYASAPNERAGNVQLRVVELSPQSKQTPYAKIKLRINASNHQIHDAIVLDKGGARYTYAIKNMKANAYIPPAKFTFKASEYPGMELVDLR